MIYELYQNAPGFSPITWVYNIKQALIGKELPSQGSSSKASLIRD